MLQARRILLSGLVALLMVGMVNADVVSPEAERPIIGAYFGTWNESEQRCDDSVDWSCLRFWFDFRIPW